jgi:hypothetical protein
MRKFLCPFLFAGLIGFALIAPGAAYAQQDDTPPLLRLVGAAGTEVRVTADDWKKLPRATVKAVDHGGAEVTFEGVPARELLKLVGAPMGHELRGEKLSLTCWPRPRTAIRSCTHWPSSTPASPMASSWWPIARTARRSVPTKVRCGW